MSMLEQKPIKSFHGKRQFWCKECMKEVQVAQHVTGKDPSPFSEGETIFWNYIVGECGHVVGDWSC